MDLTQLANLGEFIGGIAVLVTLIYLAVQVRQTKEFVRSESGRANARDWYSFISHLVDPEFMEIYRRGIDDFDGLAKNDQARLHAWLSATFLQSQSAHRDAMRGAADPTMMNAVDYFQAISIRSPGTAKWWERAKVFFDPSYRDHIEALAAAQDGTPRLTEILPWYSAERANQGD